MTYTSFDSDPAFLVRVIYARELRSLDSFWILMYSESRCLLSIFVLTFFHYEVSFIRLNVILFILNNFTDDSSLIFQFSPSPGRFVLYARLALNISVSVLLLLCSSDNFASFEIFHPGKV